MRTFKDAEGVEWTVWLVTPSVSIDGVSPPGAHLPEESADGWLAFESVRGRRRFYQYPRAWDTLSDEQLALLCAHAVPVPRTR